MKSISITKVFAFLIAAVISQLGAKGVAGGRDSAGGSGVAFYLPNKPQTPENLEKVIATDVYRATHEFITKFNLHIDPVFLTSSENNLQSPTNIESQSDKILDDLLLRLAKFNHVFVARLADAKPIIKNWTTTLPGQSLQLNMDFGPPFRLDDPSRMKMVQIIERRTHELFKDDQYYQKMDAFNRAAIKFHELAYAVSGHPSSYYIQILFAHVVSDRFDKLTEQEFKDLMIKKVNLEYQSSADKITSIKLPPGVTIVKDSDYDSTNSVDNFFNFVGGQLGGYSSKYAAEGSTCGEITNVDYDKHEIRFHYKSKKLISFDYTNYSDEYTTYSLNDEDWEQFETARDNVKAFLNANNPEYLTPGTFFNLGFTACLNTNFGIFSNFDYVEVQFGFSKSEYSEKLNEAYLKVYRIEYERKIKDLDDEEAQNKRDETIELSKARSFEQRRQIEAKYNSKQAEINSHRFNTEVIMNHREASYSIGSIIKELSDYKTIRTIGLKFSK